MVGKLSFAIIVTVCMVITMVGGALLGAKPLRSILSIAYL